MEKAKPKKSKRSFLEDDDFFVIRKKRPKSPVPAKTAAKTAPKLPDRASLPRDDRGELSSEEATSFHSARDVMSDEVTDLHAEIVEVTETPEVELKVTKAKKKPAEVDLTELDDDLENFFKGIAAVPEERTRLYAVTVTSRLGFPLEYTKQITGDTTFGELVDILLADTLREHGDTHYWRHGTLVWVEGRSELKPFFKPSTLRISPPPGGAPTKISCLYIPVEHLGNFEQLYAEFEEDKPGVVEEHSIVEVSEETTPPRSNYFVIGLKGKDNKRIEAEVGPQTEIRSLLEFYLKTKGISAAEVKRPRLLFDDEELDLGATVGDTELEEDFEVQVYL